MARYLEADAVKTLSRFDFIAEYVAIQTRKKAGRELTGDLQVKKTRGGWIYGFHGRTSCQPTTSDVLFDMIRRTDLNYFVRQAEQFRVEALSN
jgi:hypothetical protein